jgi:leucyl aminopeptidase (aminopeptidase T)
MDINNDVSERFPLSIERIRAIKEEQVIKEPFCSYFSKVADFILATVSLQQLVATGEFKKLPLNQLKEWNQRLFDDILPQQYAASYGNPSFAAAQLGDEMGKLLGLLYVQIRKNIGYAMDGSIYEMTILGELFIEIYNHFEEEGCSSAEIQKIIYLFFLDYSEIFVERRVSQMVDAHEDFCIRIIMDADLSDLRYLFAYGDYIGENELKMAAYLNTLPQAQIQSMADTYTEGFRKGFELAHKDLSKKTTVELAYPIGFERVMRAAVLNFRNMGLQAVASIGQRRGAASVFPNEQYEFDHKADAAAFLDKAYVERYLECLRVSFEKRKEIARGYAGPAVVEGFGKTPFEPKQKKESYQFDQNQQKLNVYMANVNAQIVDQYIIGKERSFTIIAYPIPEIGDQFEEIFNKTIEINNLDYNLYQQMQQKIIDLLDQATEVQITGANGNHTNLTVAIYPLTDRAKESAFENCVADVNIPVGEVFTTPVLKGTKGILHVKQVFLNSLNYLDLELTFEDGMVVSYTCKNFSKEEENQAFIKENLLHHHDRLPMGEFAIGTNTKAYRMGRDYQIEAKLPILIAEKTGPHFAVGDTCYTWSEDNPVYNPDGKEIVARDNEISLRRKESVEQAYFNCHTDITIPYDELGQIVAVKPDGGREEIISGGKFVVPGTESLNEPL